jgi:hypothetical protein
MAGIGMMILIALIAIGALVYVKIGDYRQALEKRRQQKALSAES